LISIIILAVSVKTKIGFSYRRTPSIWINSDLMAFCWFLFLVCFFFLIIQHNRHVWLKF